MKTFPLLPVGIALLTLPVVASIWLSNSGLRILHQTSGRNPEVVRKLTDLETGLANGTIKVDPPDQAKTVRTAVKVLLSRIKDDSNLYSPYVELTDMLMKNALTVFAVQFALALGIPLWHRWRKNRNVA